MAEVAVYDSALSAGQVAAHYAAAATVYRSDQTTGQRITSTLDATGWPAHMRDVHPGKTVVSPLMLTRTKVGDLLRITAETDGGTLYVDQLGRVRLDGNTVSPTPTRKTSAHSSPLERWTVRSLTESAADGVASSRPLPSSSSAVR